MSNAKNNLFEADKVSGIECAAFNTSIVAEVVKRNNTRNIFHIPFWGFILNISKDRGEEYIFEDKYEEASDTIVHYIIKNGISYFEEVEKTLSCEVEDFFNFVKEIETKIINLDDKNLIEEYRGFTEKYIHYYSLGAVTFLYESILSDRLYKSLERQGVKNIPEVLQILLFTGYKSFMNEAAEQAHLVAIEEDFSKKEDLIKKYIENFYYINSNYKYSERVNSEYFEKFRDFKPEDSCHVISQDLKIDLSDEDKAIIELFKITELIRDKRKKLNLIGSYAMSRFLDEAVKGADIKISDASKLFWFEYSDLLNKVDLESKFNRIKVTVSFDEQNGTQYQEGEKIINRKSHDIAQIKGVPASKGNVEGEVCIVLGSNEFEKFKEGQILVAEMTRPEFLPLMKKAAAIVTDEGGLTCHAAIVARELSIPCIVGTKNATLILKDGDFISVNTTTGIVQISQKV